MAGKISKKRWCDCKGWQEREAIMRMPTSCNSYIFMFIDPETKAPDYYQNTKGFKEPNYLKDYEKEVATVQDCPYCGKRIQEKYPDVKIVAYVDGYGECYVGSEDFKSEVFKEALENALFRPVEHFDDNVDNLHNDVWGSEGPDCVPCPQEVGL